MQKAYSFRVHGRVQGVGFRYFTERQGRRLGLSGWVRNEYDGSVSGFVQGDAEDVDTFAEAVRRGPATGHVSKLDLIPENPKPGLSGFIVKF